MKKYVTMLVSVMLIIALAACTATKDSGSTPAKDNGKSTAKTEKVLNYE